ncbi:DNA polymerase delta, subunit 4-domain-containing protein [Lentinula aciculospora]|uniref:DNA polymerase delta, subunit 4-domain-containing protein n=1 Tax=Lentinula aciculospora TaxID=153920 RepID=A0A9W8ZZR2_9AGAR|nr:DNA polymerase delta, subunit 4-domain-containing protein [Lentinula aciculospora]
MPVTRRTSSNARQSTLNFNTSKGSPAVAVKKAGEKAKNTNRNLLKKLETDVDDLSSFSSNSRHSSVDEIEKISDPDLVVGSLKSKRNSAVSKKKSKSKEVKGQQGQDRISMFSVILPCILNDVLSEVPSPAKERPELKIYDPRWRKLAAQARATNGNLQLIHAENENKIHDILRVFDLSYKYGPCYGISRLDRWERAEAMGLHPPPEIYDILLTRQGLEDPQYAQCVFFDQSERI